MTTATSKTRIDLQNILFTTDFSPASNAALPYATGLARHYQAKLYALHIRTPLSGEELPVTAKAVADEERAGIKMLRETTFGIEPVVLIEEGSVWPTIESAVKKNNIDLIVSGTRGRTGVGKLLLGSVAEEIVRHATCPVLTVGPHSPSHLKAGGFNHVLYATDLSPESGAAAPFATSLAQEYEAQLTLMHVIEPPKVGEMVPTADLAASDERRLHDFVSAEAEIWCEPQYVIAHGDPADKILEVAEQKQADLIVMGVRHPTGVPGAASHLPVSTVHKIIVHAKCPVLTVRTPAA